MANPLSDLQAFARAPLVAGRSRHAGLRTAVPLGAWCPRTPGEICWLMRRSEEELWIATYRRETQPARLTRYVETETVTKTVEVRHEQVRVEYEPICVADEVDRPSTGSEARPIAPKQAMPESTTAPAR